MSWVAWVRRSGPVEIQGTHGRCRGADAGLVAERDKRYVWRLTEGGRLNILPGMDRRRIQDEDRAAIAEFIERHWLTRVVISGGRSSFPHERDGFIEWRDGRIVGLLTYVIEGDGLQILTIDSTLEGQQIGSSLMLMAIEEARRRSIPRVWLITNNDNLRMVGLSQRLGFRLIEVRAGAVDEARKIKPQIPEIGRDGIAIHDELVLELRLQPSTASP